jgi:hypothetical protein
VGQGTYENDMINIQRETKAHLDEMTYFGKMYKVSLSTKSLTSQDVA